MHHFTSLDCLLLKVSQISPDRGHNQSESSKNKLLDDSLQCDQVEFKNQVYQILKLFWHGTQTSQNKSAKSLKGQSLQAEKTLE